MIQDSKTYQKNKKKSCCIVIAAEYASQLAEQQVSLFETKIILQLETSSISEEQLINKFKEIYSELMMIEKKCMKIDQNQHQINKKLNNEQ